MACGHLLSAAIPPLRVSRAVGKPNPVHVDGPGISNGVAGLTVFTGLAPVRPPDTGDTRRSNRIREEPAHPVRRRTTTRHGPGRRALPSRMAGGAALP